MSSLSSMQLTQCKISLENFEKELLNMLEGSQDASNIVTLDQSSVGRLSRMDAIQQQEMAKAELLQASKRLKLIKHALSKFNNDVYGWCEDCDEIINHERLLIKPESQYCLNCQSKRE